MNGTERSDRPILVFDSGIGGLSVLKEIRQYLPGRRIDYLADDAGFPYGERDAGDLVRRVVDLLAVGIDRLDPELVVIACNTASTLVLPPLRARFSLPFRRYRAGRQAGCRAKPERACLGSGNAGDNRPRLYARPDLPVRRALPYPSCRRAGSGSAGRGIPSRRGDFRCRYPAPDCALLRNRADRSHRPYRIGMHTFSVSRVSFQGTRPMAGHMARSSAGNRPARRQSGNRRQIETC